MHAVIGVLLLALAVNLFQFAYVIHRRPEPPAWTRPEMGSQLIVFLVLASLGSGVGFIVHFSANNEFATFSVADIGLLVAIVVIAAIPFVYMRRSFRLQRAQAAEARAARASGGNTRPAT